MALAMPFTWKTAIIAGTAALASGGLVVAVLAWNPQAASAPESNHVPVAPVTARVNQPAKIPPAIAAVPPPVEAADEVVVIVNDQPLEHTLDTRLLAPPRSDHAPVLYFGDVPAGHRTFGGSPAGGTGKKDRLLDAVRWLIAAQTKEGLWLGPDPESTVINTSLAILALQAAAPMAKVQQIDVEVTASAARRALLATGDADGCFGGDAVAAHVLAMAALGPYLKSRDREAAQRWLDRCKLGDGWPSRHGEAQSDSLATYLTACVVPPQDHPPNIDRIDQDRAPRFGAIARDTWTAPLHALLTERAWLHKATPSASQETRTVLANALSTDAAAADLMLLQLVLTARVDHSWLGTAAIDKLCAVLIKSQQAAGNWREQPPLTECGATASAIISLLALDVRSGAAAAEANDKRTRDKDQSPDTPEFSAKPAVPGQGCILCRNYKPDSPLPLHHTSVRAQISGIVGSTRVTQTFMNGHPVAIEAVYCFPLPHNAAITDFVLVAGNRRIRAMLRPRAEASREYTEAVARGQTAAIMTRERGNVFNHYIGNIAPGARLDVEITYFELVSQKDGVLEWVFPMVVGPYFTAGTPRRTADDGTRVKGHGWDADTDRVPDASRVTPPTLPEGMRSGHDISLEVTLASGFELETLDVVTHRVLIDKTAPGVATVTLAADDAVPDRDFVMRWKLKEGGPNAVVLAHKPDATQPGWFTLLVRPGDQNHERRGAREVTFVMDVSGSMTGVPIAMCKQVVADALATLSPDDTFNVFYFSGQSGSIFASHQPADAANIAGAISAVESLRAGGGTHMLEGLKHALAAPQDGTRERVFCFLTDGMVSEAPAIIEFVRANVGRAQFLVFGVGGSVNRDLVDGVALAGSGRSVYCIPGDPETNSRAVAAFVQFIGSRALTAVTADWAGAPVFAVTPGALPVTHKGDVIAMAGMYRQPFKGAVVLNGTLDGPVAIELPAQTDANPAVRHLWAAWTLYDLERALPDLNSPVIPVERAAELTAATNKIARFAVSERLSTRWTAFVVIDEESRVGDGAPRTVVQPVELPKDVDRNGVGR